MASTSGFNDKSSSTTSSQSLLSLICRIFFSLGSIPCDIIISRKTDSLSTASSFVNSPESIHACIIRHNIIGMIAVEAHLDFSFFELHRDLYFISIIPDRIDSDDRQIIYLHVFALRPKDVGAPENIFVAVFSWQWISIPMVTSYSITLPPPADPYNL